MACRSSTLTRIALIALCYGCFFRSTCWGFSSSNSIPLVPTRIGGRRRDSVLRISSMDGADGSMDRFLPDSVDTNIESGRSPGLVVSRTWFLEEHDMTETNERANKMNTRRQIRKISNTATKMLAVLMVASLCIRGLALSWTIQQQPMNLLRGVSMWYMNHLRQNPLVTKSVSCGLIGICGDAMAQWVEGRVRSKNRHVYNRRRGVANLADGLLLSGPLMHWAYTWFEHVLPITDSTTAMLHSVADCIFLDSVFVAIAIVMTGIMEGYSPRFVRNQLLNEFGGTMKASWTTSIMLLPVEVVCFRFLPLSLRTLAINFIDVVWDAVISFMAHKSRRTPHVANDQLRAST